MFIVAYNGLPLGLKTLDGVRGAFIFLIGLIQTNYHLQAGRIEAISIIR